VAEAIKVMHQVNLRLLPALTIRTCVVVAAVVTSLLAVGPPASTPSSGSWSPKAAAAYLDYRETWWIGWPVAARDRGTFCVSCHTAVPYALARPALHAALGENAPSADERKLLDNVTKRVRMWSVVEPFYSDQKTGPHKTAQARGTESVLNALILASYDARNGTLSADTRTALDDMWALQQTSGPLKGAWQWLQFDNEPFEAHDSDYYGAALGAVAAGTAPGGYLAYPAIQNNLRLLRDYLNREYGSQSPINHAVLLWASAKWPGLLTQARKEEIIHDILSEQRADGGWSLSSLAWTWRDWTPTTLVKLWWRSNATPFEPKSDGYATGLMSYALEQAGFSRDELHLRRGLGWLERNQNKADGRWPGYSLNNRVDPSSEMGHFMSDVGTAYAVLALTPSP
jgi:squalene-hopene/tetraprenyl-beta-curcumene cyclase